MSTSRVARRISTSLGAKMSILPKRPLVIGLIAVIALWPTNARAQSIDTALQARGKMAMGVDQYKSAHHFDVLPDGGRIALEMKNDDSLSIAQIRAHLKLIQYAFQAGDFSTPEFVHMRAMPGTAVMARRKDLIRYTYSDLPRGGQVRITTSDAASLQAIRQFMSAQRGDHKAEGHDSIATK